MQLSERGAIRSAIADGGFHLYPAGHLVEIIQEGLAGDGLRDNFDPTTTPAKVMRVAGPEGHARAIFERDRALLCERLERMSPDYDIESVFTRMMAAAPAMAKRYYGIDDFSVPHPKVVEYFFEGYNDLYKDGDWFAFNVNSAEAKELDVPIGIYFKRDQVSPGHPELTTLHEANHAMQDAAGLAAAGHHYIPWMDEGFADALGRCMLARATEDWELIAKLKASRMEVEVTDPRKVTYHYGEETAALILLRGRLPFFRALLKARAREPFAIDWNTFACRIKEGFDPHVALATSYRGKKPEAFRKQFDREESQFRKEPDFDQMDLRVLSLFLATQAPACIPTDEYEAALWLTAAVNERPCPYPVDPSAVPEELRAKIPAWRGDAPIPAETIPVELWEKAPILATKIVIPEGDVPHELNAGVAALAAKYFILKRSIGGVTVYEPYGGGLPYRMATGEVRCAY